MKNQSKIFWIATLITVGWIIFMRPYTPKNIVAFELAKTIPVAEKIIADWGAEGLNKARTSIYLDFVFIILYCTSITLGCKVAAQYTGIKKIIYVAGILAFAIWLAGLLDVIENLCMLKTLAAPTLLTVTVSFYTATIKFLIVLGSLLFILTSAIIGVLKKQEARFF